MSQFFFSVVSYIAGLSSIAAFFWYIQFEIDKSPSPFSWISFGFNLVLFLIFPLQHSLLPRPKVKKWIHEHSSAYLERPLYVATSGIAMWTVLLGWRSMGPILFDIRNALPFQIAFYISLSLIILCTVALDHSSMFGLKQGYYAWKRRELPKAELQTSGLYGVVRHPLTSLLIVCLWSHSTMTAGRLLWNLLFTLYSIVGTVFEEKDLLKNFGSEYESYRRRVPAFVPFLK